VEETGSTADENGADASDNEGSSGASTGSNEGAGEEENSASEADQRQEEYENAKNYCDSPPKKPGNGATQNELCSYLSSAIGHSEECTSRYQDWDAKWFPGRHAEKILGWQKRTQNLKAEHNLKCTGYGE
jgi:type VI secretion system secreted protein VgrG